MTTNRSASSAAPSAAPAPSPAPSPGAGPDPDPAGLEGPSPARHARGPLLIGTAIVLVGLVGSTVWAAVAPLASAAIAPGQVIVDSERKTIQHLEGGIIKDILVSEGDRVTAGAPLVILDDTQARVMLEVIRGEFVALKAQEARLLAERDGHDRIAFDHEIFADTDVEGRHQAMEGQRGVFEARRAALDSRIDISQRRIAQLRDQIAGLESQVAASDRQIALIADESRGVQELFDRGHERKPRLLALQRTAAQLEGQRGEYLSNIAEAHQRIGETDLTVIDLRAQFMAEVVADLDDVRTRLADLAERLRAASDRVERSTVAAPTDGVVVNVRFHTIGGVVPPGGDLLDLVPTDDDLVIEAMVRPEDIDAVHPGLPAEVRITAFHSRDTPTLQATVQRVSADTLEDRATGLSFYRARVVIDDAALAALGDLQLYPGMPAEVMIETGSRSALDIALSPILDSMNRSFREE